MNQLISILLTGFLLCGCASAGKVPAGDDKLIAPEKLEIRNNAASLLYYLLNQEKNVSKILIIKLNSQELGQLIKSVSEAATDGEKQLEGLAKSNPNLNLRAVQLPEGEKATRNAVAKTEEHELLFSSGKEFEFNLLLTQAEALNYGWHLAKIAAENSSSPEEVQIFTALSQKLENLYGQVIGQMRQPR